MIRCPDWPQSLLGAHACLLVLLCYTTNVKFNELQYAHSVYSFSQQFKTIRILHGCEVPLENSVLRVTVWHHERGFVEWCKTVIPRDGIFYPHQTLMFDSFSCIPFVFECFILKVEFITTHNDAEVGHLTSLWRRNDINLTTKLRDVLYNQCKPNSREKCFFFFFFFFFLSWVRIWISIPSENLGFPYRECKKILSTCKCLLILPA